MVSSLVVLSLASVIMAIGIVLLEAKIKRLDQEHQKDAEEIRRLKGRLGSAITVAELEEGQAYEVEREIEVVESPWNFLVLSYYGLSKFSRTVILLRYREGEYTPGSAFVRKSGDKLETILLSQEQQPGETSVSLEDEGPAKSA